MGKHLNYTFHYLCYYATWILTIHLASLDYAWWNTLFLLIIAVIQVLWQYYIVKVTAHLTSFIILFTVVGTFVDTVFLYLGLITFHANPFSPYCSPPWMIGLWLSFAIVFYATAPGLFHRYFVLAVFSFIGFPLAYFIGVQMKAAAFAHFYLSLFAIGTAWCFIFPLVFYIYNNWIAHDA